MEVTRQCDVCVILDGNATPKPVRYCGLCDKWICAACWPDLARRAEAVYVANNFFFRLRQAVQRVFA